MIINLIKSKKSVFELLRSIAFIAVPFYFIENIFVDSLRSELRDLHDKKAVAKKTLERKLFESANIEQYHTQLIEIESIFNKNLFFWYEHIDNPAVYQNVGELAKQSGLQIRRYEPLPVLDIEYFAVHPVEVLLTGDLHSGMKFVADILNQERLVTVASMHLHKKDDVLYWNITLNNHLYKKRE